jgi:hypothetical protein
VPVFIESDEILEIAQIHGQAGTEVRIR